MKNEKILDAIGKISEEYIEEAAPEKKKSKKSAWVRWGGIAACLVLVVYAGIRYIPPALFDPDISEPPGAAEALPMLTLPAESGGMGFEGLLAYDISQLEDGNPWTEDTQLKTLPVFTNTAYDDPSGLPVSDMGEERMAEIAEQTAAALDMEITDISYRRVGDIAKDSDIADRDRVYQVTATTDTARIEVEVNCVTVFFSESVRLPEEYDFTDTNPSEEEAERAMDYLMEKYAGLLAFSIPRKALFADYFFDGSLHRSYYAYDAAGGVTDQILSFHFDQAEFASNEDGDLWLIRMYNNLACAEKIGDYPVITPDKARGLLLDGHYTTSVPEEMPGEEYVMKEELVYRVGNAAEIFLPYYRFLVELPGLRQENGLKTYGAYYVPAVEQKYISNMPLWDGSFN